MVVLCGAEFWTPRGPVARGIKGSGPRLTLTRKARVGKYTSRNPSDLYTHIKKVGVVFLIDNQHNHVFISI